MSWKEDYESKIISAEEAVKVIKSGDSVAFAYGTESRSLGLALLNRAKNLKDVKLFMPAPGRSFDWYDEGYEDNFHIQVAHILPVVQKMMNEKRGDFLVGSMLWTHDFEDIGKTDVLIAQLSTPDENGFCGFGSALWDKKQAVHDAKIVLAEVNKHYIRTYGDNYVHVSELDYIVEHVSSGRKPGATDMLGRENVGPSDVVKNIAGHIATLIRDGDCIEIGVGGAAEWLPRLGVFDDKNDIGVHAENLPPGIVDLVRKGIITGRLKSNHKGKVVSTACGGSGKDDMDYINMNPLFELYESKYILDTRTIAVNDNVVAINSALSVDLTGQIAAESLGYKMLSSTGGQLAFAIGAALSKGGRCINVLPAAAKGGAVSRIVSAFEPGTVVSVPRTLADIVVTEFGVAKLKGKTQRQRTQELIAVAHPDFRAELQKEARRLYFS